MSEQALDLTRSMRILRRHRILVGALAVLGLLAGAGYSVWKPPMFTSGVTVVLPVAKGSASQANSTPTSTQAVIAKSSPVLAGASRHLGGTLSVPALNERVSVTSPAPTILEITASGTTADQAEDTANAVANSYLSYLASGQIPGGPILARALGKATPATGTSIGVRIAETGVIGLLPGLLIGIIIALAIGRGDRRLRARDQIADSIGVPVLASIATEQARDAAGWARLLDRYEPRLVDGWHLRKALFQLGLVGMNPAGSAADGKSADSNGSSLAVLSLSSDKGAVALGPQLAAFTASLGIRTALIIGPQQSESATATLYAACAAAPPLRSGHLLVAVTDHDNIGLLTGVALTITVGVVDPDNPRVAATTRAATTVLGVSAGAATAEQLARVATSAAVDDRDIAGIIVADPDPADQTTGRLPQVGRLSERRMPTRHARSHQ